MKTATFVKSALILCAFALTLVPNSVAQTLTTLHIFCSETNCADGDYAAAGLVQGTDGNFYGTTELGGTNRSAACNFANSCGTVFKITAKGELTTYSLDGTNPHPLAGLVQATNGDFYGTTAGGTVGSGDAQNYGTVFKITAGGMLTTLHTFDRTDANPVAGLVGQLAEARRAMARFSKSPQRAC
jgi:uncharacterized repeat protein (TIGR03803 family)